MPMRREFRYWIRAEAAYLLKEVLDVQQDTFEVRIKFIHIHLLNSHDLLGGVGESIIMSHLVPQEQVLSNQFGPTIMRTMLSDFNLPPYFVNYMVRLFLNYAKGKVNSRETNGGRVLPLCLEIKQVSYVEDVSSGMQQAINQSIEESKSNMTPATEESIAALKNTKVLHEWLSCKEERRVVCLEDFLPGQTTLSMPCSHFFHEDCIVQWLKTSHLCPFCRYAMPS